MDAVWLIRWSWDDAAEPVESPLISIQPRERTPEEIRTRDEAFYAASSYDPESLLRFAEDPWSAPCLSKLERVGGGGTRISCGVGTRIEASEARSVTVEGDSDRRRVSWRERGENGWVSRSLDLVENAPAAFQAAG